jgi:hypothetical protein
MGTRTYVSKKNESDAWKDGIASAANNFKGFKGSRERSFRAKRGFRVCAVLVELAWREKHRK